MLLLLFFFTSSILSRLGSARKAALVGPLVEKDDERDAWQVLANGGIFTAAALGFLLFRSSMSYPIAIGALAASTSDTWATEVGTWLGEQPVSIIGGRRVPTGTSGGITLFGTLAAAAGALFISLAATLAQWPVALAAATLGGMAGAITDSILGGTLQDRRFCDACATATERLVHDCGTSTRHVGGLQWLDNDAVNAVSTGVGALVTLVLF